MDMESTHFFYTIRMVKEISKRFVPNTIFAGFLYKISPKFSSLSYFQDTVFAFVLRKLVVHSSSKYRVFQKL